MVISATTVWTYSRPWVPPVSANCCAYALTISASACLQALGSDHRGLEQRYQLVKAQRNKLLAAYQKIAVETGARCAECCCSWIGALSGDSLHSVGASSALCWPLLAGITHGQVEMV